MRESYGTLFDRFWDGPTGRELQVRGKDAVILAAYLLSNRYANMIGLYELPIVTIAHHLPVLGAGMGVRTRAIRKGRDALAEVDFAYVDEGTSFVWVKEMARIRMQLEPGEALARDDNRVHAINKLYASLKPNPFLGPFFSRYAKDLKLTARSHVNQEAPSKGLPSPSEAPPKPLASPSEASNSQQEQQQVQVQKTGTGTGTETEEKASAAPIFARSDEETHPEENLEVIVALVTKELIPLGVASDDLPEATKERCARLGIAYNSQVVRQAIDVAQFRDHLNRPLLEPR